MIRYLAKRGITYVFMIFLTTSAGYFLAVSSLKPALLEQERIPRPTPEQVANSMRLKGLDPDLSPWERYVQWLSGIVTRWDWGRSPNGAFINAEFGDRVWISTRLFLASIVLTLVIGVALGVYSAARQYKFQDRVITSYSYLAYIVPAPIAYFLVQLGAININETVGERIFFVTGISTPGMQPGWAQFVDMVGHYAVPTIAITLVGWGSYQIAQRQYLLDNVNADFVRTARAKGLTRNQAITRHALRSPSSRSPKASRSPSRPSSPAAFSRRRSSPGQEWAPGALMPSRCRMSMRPQPPSPTARSSSPWAPSWQTSPPRLLTRE